MLIKFLLGAVKKEKKIEKDKEDYKIRRSLEHSSGKKYFLVEN